MQGQVIVAIEKYIESELKKCLGKKSAKKNAHLMECQEIATRLREIKGPVEKNILPSLAAPRA